MSIHTDILKTCDDLQSWKDTNENRLLDDTKQNTPKMKR